MDVGDSVFGFLHSQVLQEMASKVTSFWPVDLVRPCAQRGCSKCTCTVLNPCCLHNRHPLHCTVL